MPVVFDRIVHDIQLEPPRKSTKELNGRQITGDTGRLQTVTQTRMANICYQRPKVSKYLHTIVDIRLVHTPPELHLRPQITLSHFRRGHYGMRDEPRAKMHDHRRLLSSPNRSIFHTTAGRREMPLARSFITPGACAAKAPTAMELRLAQRAYESTNTRLSATMATVQPMHGRSIVAAK